MSQPAEETYPVTKISISGDDVKKYKVRVVGINLGEGGVHPAGTIECSLADAFRAIELMLQGHDVEGFYPGQEKRSWLLLGVHQDDKPSLDRAYIIQEGDIPLAFYQGSQWFLPLPDNTPIGSNHPDATPLKQEEPDDWFSDKPVPTWTFGDRISCPNILVQNKALEGEVIGLVWLPYKKGHSWWYCVASQGEDTGWWISETEIRDSSVASTELVC